MVTYNIEISEPAENDLRDIIRYISSQLSSPMTAMKMMDTIEAALLGLSDMSQKCAAVRDDRLAAMGYRKLLIKNYVVFFRIGELSKVVNDERILYARRDWLRIV
ncbi:MAG: type II toxin-antitoxin system RelE/ParE family toxin [Firmicutes bacterium HGW-Firmicutes-4]|jgi:plasmid stabilization system protein ParE|nr:MAG: type II toxin-antitoxin system RelE/ParE family toxin [Firmicutes bacterium HGW-Firmicutes-4]